MTIRILERGVCMGENRLEHKGCRARRLWWEHLGLVSQVKGLGFYLHRQQGTTEGDSAGV